MNAYNYSYFRPGWSPFSVLAMVLGFLVFWPIGLAVLAWILWGERFGWAPGADWISRQKTRGGWCQNRQQSWQDRRSNFGGGWGQGPSSGNAAFDAYRADQLKRLDSGEIDVGLLRPPVPRTGLRAFRVCAEVMIAAVPAGHPLATDEAIQLEDLAAEPFIAYAPYEARYFHDLVVELFTRAGLMPDYVQHLAQIHSILAMVHSGVGVAIVPEAAVSLHFSGVVLRPLALPQQRKAELYFVSREDNDNPLLPTIATLARELATAV